MGKLSTFVFAIILAIVFIMAVTSTDSRMNHDADDNYQIAIRSHHSDVEVFFNTLLGKGIDQPPERARPR